MTEKLELVLGRVENILRKGENAGFQHFLLFPQCFQKASFSGSLKVGIVCGKGFFTQHVQNMSYLLSSREVQDIHNYRGKKIKLWKATGYFKVKKISFSWQICYFYV